MRLTSKKVAVVRGAIVAGTGEQWFQIGRNLDNGTRYIGTCEEVVYLGGKGAAQALSYLAGVAAVYGVDLSEPEVKEVLEYLYQSGRFDPTADERGRDRARWRREHGR